MLQVCDAIWVLSYVGPQGFKVPAARSFLAIVCRQIAPILAPLGFGTGLVVAYAISFIVHHGGQLLGIGA